MSNGGAQLMAFGPFIDSDGDVRTSVKIYHYAAGTTNNLAAWSDEAKTKPLADPWIPSDASGIFTAFFDGDYQIVIDDSDDVNILTKDNWKITSDTGTMWEGNRGTAYPAAAAVNKGQMFALVDGSDNLLEVAINADGTAWIPTARPIGKGADIASAATLVIPNDGNSHDVTGTTGITAIQAKREGTLEWLQFDGILTITHHAANLKLPGGNNITTSAGLILAFEEYAAGQWQLASGSLLPHDHADASSGGNTLTAPTIITPTIVDQTNSNHIHDKAASTGGPIAPAYALVSKTAAYTATSTDSVILVDATSGAVTITFPTAVGIGGKAYTIKKIDSSTNDVTVDGNGAETIDGAANYKLYTQYDSVEMMSDNTNWAKLSESFGTAFFVGKFNWDTSTTGAQAVTGVGFKPKSIMFIAATGSAGEASWGLATSSDAKCVFDNYNSTANTYAFLDTASGRINEGGGKTSSFSVSSFDDDGFTISKTKAGAPSGTAFVIFEAKR
jgi:hypothetical protein